MVVTRSPKSFRAVRFVAPLLLLVTVIVIVILEATNTIHIFHKAKQLPPGTTGNSYTKVTPNPSTTQNTPSTSNPNSPGAPPQQATPSAPTEPLMAPWGTYSNVNSAKMDDQMESTCNTTPGATCQVIFTNGNLTESLRPDTADAGGAVYWAWKPVDIGLSPGVWHETMKATLGSQTKISSNDPLTLEITQ